MAVLALVAVGAGVGFTTAGVIGAVVGAGIGFLASKALQKKGGSSSLDDLKAAKVSYGAVIPYAEGHPRLGGFVAYQSDRRKSESSSSSGGGSGGGGGEVTTTSYAVDAMWVLTENIAGSLRKVFDNGELVWTMGDDADDASVANVSEKWDRITFYSGAADQLPDPTYEAQVGVTRALAYRTRSSVFIENLQLGTGGQLPNLTFEIVVEDGGLTVDTGGNPPVFMALFDDGTANDTGPGAIVASVGANASVVTTGPGVGHARMFHALEEASSDSQIAWGGDSIDRPADTLMVVELYTSWTTLSNVTGHTIFEYVDTISGAFEKVVYYADAGLLLWGNNVSADVTAVTPIPANTRVKITIRLNADGVNSTLAVNDEVIFTRATSHGAYTSPFIRCGTHIAGAYDYTVDDLKVWLGEPAVASGGGRQALVEPTLQQAVERQCTRAGLSLGSVEASALASRNVHAMALTQIAPPRQAIETLMQAYFVTVSEIGGVLTFDWRGKDAVATIPYEDLMAGDDGVTEPLEITIGNDLEIPAQVDVKYANLFDNFQDGLESSDRLISTGESTIAVDIPLGFDPVDAKKIADSLILDAATSAKTFNFSLTRKWSKLEPADVVNVVDISGVTFRLRLTKKTETDGVATFEAVSDDANIITSDATTDTTGYTNSTAVRPPIDTTSALLDIPILRDADNDSGFYAMVAPATDVAYPGAVLFKSSDDVTYTRSVTAETAGVLGVAATVLGSGPVGVFDEMNSVTVNIGAGTAASVPRDSILNSTVNTWVIGAEVIQARDATLVSPGVYTLTGLLRGLLGTEWAVGTHAADEVVAMPTESTVWRVPMNNSDLGIAKFWKAVTVGRATSTATAETFTDNAVGLKPRAPVDVRFSRNAIGDIAITMQRRSRLSSRLIGAMGVSCPLGEDSERFELDIYNSSFTTVKRTLTSAPTAGSNPSFTYLAADQTTDFGGAQAIAYAKGYQLSGAVGRGYAAQAQG
jgi:hypothetical protein